MRVYDAVLWITGALFVGAAIGAFVNHHLSEALYWGIAGGVALYCGRRYWR